MALKLKCLCFSTSWVLCPTVVFGEVLVLSWSLDYLWRMLQLQNCITLLWWKHWLWSSAWLSLFLVVRSGCLRMIVFVIIDFTHSRGFSDTARKQRRCWCGQIILRVLVVHLKSLFYELKDKCPFNWLRNFQMVKNAFSKYYTQNCTLKFSLKTNGKWTVFIHFPHILTSQSTFITRVGIHLDGHTLTAEYKVSWGTQTSIYSPVAQPLVAILGSVSCPKTLQRTDQRSQRSNHWPSD